MRTAKTIQILDANNNNISPATCIDSLYFELPGNDGNIYRMSLRNRTLVAADNMSVIPPMNSAITTLDDLEIPYCYVTAATNSVYQLNTATVNIGGTIGDAIKNVSTLNNYYTKTTTDQLFMKKNSEYVYIGPDDKPQVRLFAVNDSSKYGMELPNPQKSDEYCGYVGLNYQTEANGSHYPKLTIHNDYSVRIESSAGNIEMSTPNVMDVSVGTLNIDTSVTRVNAKSLLVDSSAGLTKIDTSVFELNIAPPKITLNCSSYIHADNNGIDISSGSLKFFGTQFPNTSIATADNTNKAFSLILAHDASTNKTEMTWETNPVLTIQSTLNIDSENNASVNYMSTFKDSSCIIRHLTFHGYGTDDTSVLDEEIFKIDRENQTGINIRYIRNIPDENCPTIKQPLGYSDTSDGAPTYQKSKYITLKLFGDPLRSYNILKTENDENYIPVVFQNSEQFTKKVDLGIEDAPNSQTFYILGINQSNINSINNESGREGTIYRTERVYFNSDNVYANSYYSTSDKRLKENVSEIGYDVATPEVVSFNWKVNGEKSYGFIAQDLERQGLSELVVTDQNGYKKVDYNAALALALGKLQQENRELRNELEYIKSLVLNNI